MNDAEKTKAQLIEELTGLRREFEEASRAPAGGAAGTSSQDEGEARYRLLMEALPDPVVLYNPDGTMAYANPAFSRVYGWSLEEWLGRRVDFVPPGEIKKTRRGIDLVLAGQTWLTETKRLTQSGEIVDVQIKTAPYTDAKGNLTGIYAIHHDITGVKQTQAALRHSEKRYGQLLDASPDPITVYDHKGKVTYINPAFEDTFGWNIQELAGKGIAFVPPHEIEKTRDAVKRTLEGEKVLLESQRLTKDGRILDIQLKTSIFTDEDGNLAGDIVIYRDISLRKRAEEAILASEARMQLLLDASPDPITVYDHKGKVTYINPAFEDTFGWNLEELAGKGIDFVPPHEIEKTREAVGRTLKGEKVLLESQRLTKDGRMLDIQLKTAIFTDADGNLAGDIVIYRDISERKKIEQEIRRHRDHLEELVDERTGELSPAISSLQSEVVRHKATASALAAAEANYRRLYEEAHQAETLFRSLLNSSADATIVYDMDGLVNYLNPAFTQTFGWTLEELENNRLDFVPPEEETITKQEVSEVVHGGLKCRNFETKRYTKDRRLVHVNISASRFDDFNGDPIGMLVIMRDTTQRIKAKKERRRLEEQLRQALKMEAVGVLASGIAHDFNNILQVLSGYLQIMRLKSGDPFKAFASQLEEMDHLVERGADLVRGLLTFGRKVDPELTPLDLNQTVENTMKVLIRTIPKMIRIDTSLAPDLPPILGDSNQLEHLLVNLANNAKDAMPTGGRLLLSSSLLEPDHEMVTSHPELIPGRYVLLEVSDTGVGIGPDNLEHIFDPFYTTKGVGKGTGLGLSTAYGIVTGHGGSIYCSSQDGQGATFHIFLPSPHRDNIQAQPPSASSQALTKGEETILLVDDETSIAQVAGEILSQFGYQVFTATSGEKALEFFEQKGAEINLIIMDLGMPGMGGKAAMGAILERDQQAKVLIASGYSGDEQVKECLLAGAAGFLPKPYRLEVMINMVRKLLDE